MVSVTLLSQGLEWLLLWEQWIEGTGGRGKPVKLPWSSSQLSSRWPPPAPGALNFIGPLSILTRSHARFCLIVACIVHSENTSSWSDAALCWYISLHDIKKLISPPISWEKPLHIGKLSSSCWQIHIFQTSHFHLKAWILSLVTNTFHFPQYNKFTLFIFNKMSAVYQGLHKHSLSLIYSFK